MWCLDYMAALLIHQTLDLPITTDCEVTQLIVRVGLLNGLKGA